LLQIGGVDALALAAGLMARELELEHIVGFEQRIDHRGVEPQIVLAHLVEQGFEHMGQLGHVGETEGRAAALDRMRGTKDRVQILVIGRLEIEVEQQVLEAGEVLARFLEEHPVELGEIESATGG
jgi:hypothetical protein